MKHNYERYIEEVRGLNIKISPNERALLEEALGNDLDRRPSTRDIEKAQTWVHSETKQRFERALALFATYAGGKRIMEDLASRVARKYGGNGYFEHYVGFLGTNGPTLVKQIKIRTMRDRAETELNSPFNHTSFLAGKADGDDRILASGLVKAARRSGFDELPQIVKQIALKNKTMDLVGARGYTIPELEGTKILIELRDRKELGFSDEERELLAKYRELIERYKPKIALLGHLSATSAKDTPHLVRMLGDIAYCERASPMVDLRLTIFTFIRRAQGVGAR